LISIRALAVAVATTLAVTLFSSPAFAAKKKKTAEPAPVVLDSAAAAALADSVFRASQEFASQKFIYTLLAGDLDSLKVLFDEEVRDQVTNEVMEYMRGQDKLFYDMVQGDFELFGSGQRDSSFFREYRIANETNKRYPLIVIQVVFEDSLSTKLIGAEVKNFLGGNEKRISGEHSWTIGEKVYDIHSIVLIPLDSGSILAVQYFEDDTGKVNQDFVAAKGIPIVKELVARGFRDSALAVLEGKKLIDDVGVVFIRNDPLAGLVHIKVGFRPEDFGGLPEKPKKAEKAAKAPPAKKKAPAKK
jgi:hypothetical protein